MPSRNTLPPLPSETELETIAQVDEQGRLILPDEIAAQWGLSPGDRVQVSANGHRLTLLRSPHHLVKLYVEPTTVCNLDCRTCMRNNWGEPPGHMPFDLYQQILEQTQAMPDLRLLSLGGIGEPLAHPRLPEMVAQAKAQGLAVELVTNGTLLKPALARALIQAGLDLLWVSIDGTTPESYDHVRGTQLQRVLDQLVNVHRLQRKMRRTKPELGLAFVAMRRNVGDLAELSRLARRVGAARMMVTNVIPYTRELADEILYDIALFLPQSGPSPLSPQLCLPNMDWDDQNIAIMARQLVHSNPLRLGQIPITWPRDTCRFVQEGYCVVGRDGRVSPCLGLLHPHTTYLHGYERQVRAYTLGNVADRPLSEIWQDPEYVAFRERVTAFDFSPCTLCGGCDYLEANETDCYGSPFPACGGCLWAQGIVQCP
jgi:MoaA/NifB/PqqE/SkfB family radical SAM enzyme